VPNAIDVSSFTSTRDRNDLRRSLGIPEDAPLIGNIARIVPWKGQNRLVAAFAPVKRELPDAHLLLIGGVQDTPPDSAAFDKELRDQIARAGLESAVHFLGVRKDVPDLLSTIDVYAMASRDEPFGLVYLEAMAARKAIVADRSGGTPEVIRDG